MNEITLTQDALATIIANAVAEGVAAALSGTTTTTAPARYSDADYLAVNPNVAKAQPESLVAAKSHCYEARMTRRADATRKGGAGMTKAEKSELYAALVAKHGKRPTTAQWNAACKKARGI